MLVYVLLTIIIFEVLLRIMCGIRGITPWAVQKIRFREWIKLDKNIFFKPRPFYKGKIYNIPMQFNNLGLRDSNVSSKKPGEKRIVCLGDSVTFGNHIYSESSYPKVLESILRAESDKNISVINAGVLGYTTYQGLEFLKEHFEELCPDIITVAFNFNERRLIKSHEFKHGPDYSRNYYNKFKYAYGKLSSFLIKSYIGLFMYSLVKKFGVLLKRKPGINKKNITSDDLRPRISEPEYKEYLRGFARLAKEKNIRIVFINLCDSPDRVEDIYKGLRMHEQDQHNEALSTIRNVTNSKLRCFRSLAHYQLGRIYEAMGRFDRSGREYKHAFEKAHFELDILGGPPIRTDMDYQDIMRNTARENSIPILDLPAVFDDRSLYFKDFCHLDEKGHKWIAEELFKIITDNSMLVN